MESKTLQNYTSKTKPYKPTNKNTQFKFLKHPTIFSQIP